MKATKLPATIIAESGPQPTMEELGEISKLITEAWMIEERIEKGKALLEKLTGMVNLIKTKQLPDLMAKFNMAEFKTTDGISVKVKPFYSGKILSPAAYDWLNANGHGGAIKTEVVVPLVKGQMELGKEIVKYLADKQYTGLLNTEVHHQTLNALVKEIMENGKTLPEDLFSTYTGRVAKVSRK